MIGTENKTLMIADKEEYLVIFASMSQDKQKIMLDKGLIPAETPMKTATPLPPKVSPLAPKVSSFAQKVIPLISFENFRRRR